MSEPGRINYMPLYHIDVSDIGQTVGYPTPFGEIPPIRVAGL